MRLIRATPMERRDLIIQHPVIGSIIFCGCIILPLIALMLLNYAMADALTMRTALILGGVTLAVWGGTSVWAARKFREMANPVTITPDHSATFDVVRRQRGFQRRWFWILLAVVCLSSILWVLSAVVAGDLQSAAFGGLTFFVGYPTICGIRAGYLAKELAAWAEAGERPPLDVRVGVAGGPTCRGRLVADAGGVRLEGTTDEVGVQGWRTAAVTARRLHPAWVDLGAGVSISPLTTSDPGGWWYPRRLAVVSRGSGSPGATLATFVRETGATL